MSEQDIVDIIEDAVDIARMMHQRPEPLFRWLMEQRPDSPLSEALENEIEKHAAVRGMHA